jgi:pyridoxal phosphate enzyme (YggS family)
MNASDDSVQAKLRQNINSVQEQVEAALNAAGRPLDSVKLVAVSKYVDAGLTWQLVEAGCCELGESRPQSIWQKHQSFAEQHAHQQTQLSQVRWHMIGHLQRNKAARTLPLLACLHSLDSLRLAETVHAEAAKQNLRVKCLLEVNPTEDATKTGLPIAEAARTLEQILAFSGIEICGLMSMSTDGAPPEQARREFESVRALRDELQQLCGNSCRLTELSMGMSGDFPQAIAAGATMIRVGSVLWSGIMG